LIITLYSRILSSERTAPGLIQSSLPVLKSICERSLQARGPSTNLVDNVLQALLAACLQNVDDVRDRESPSAVNKAAGNLLAAVLILSTLPHELKLSRATIEHCCQLLSQSVSFVNENVALTAIHCTRTLIIASVRGGPAIQYCVAQLLPSLVSSIAQASASATMSPFIVEQMKALSAFATIIPPKHRREAYSTVVPIFLLFLPASAEPSTTYSQAASQLLALANHDPAAFKDTTLALDAEQKRLLETSIRQSMGTSTVPAALNVASSIDLKMDF